MNTLYGDVNERLVIRATSNLVTELRPELAVFLRHLGLSHLLEELFLPLAATTRMSAAVAYDERPWPPEGVGARAIRGLALAVVSDDGQSLLTPCFLAPQFVSNVGLAAALTKTLVETLAANKTEWIGVFVNERSRVVAAELTNAGFEPRAGRVLTDGAEFVAFVVRPDALLGNLGLADMRVGDVLDLRMEAAALSKVAAFHFSLVAGIANHWAGRTNWAEVFPGLIDWAALPPGGITGTAGPGAGPLGPVVILQG
jgi:hypothetical protein